MSDAPESPAADWAAALAADWAAALAAIDVAPLGAEHATRVAEGLAEQIATAADEPEAVRKVGAQIANTLIDANFHQPLCLGTSLEVLDRHLPARFGPPARAALRSGLAIGFADRLRERTRVEQASIHEAVLSAYRTGEARFRTVFLGAALGIGIVDRHGRVVEVNPALAEMLGADPRAARGQDIKSLMKVAEEDEYWARHDELLAGKSPAYSLESRILRPDGSVVWTRLRATAVRDDDGGIAMVIGLYEDITEHRLASERLRHQATHDALTGLPNRLRLLEEVEDLLDRAGPGERLGLCFLDLDGFKAVNDTLGHQAGDHLLTVVAARLTRAASRAVPKARLVARMGGDEFVLLCPRTHGPQALVRAAEQMLAAVREPVLLDGHTLTVTASAGLVERPAAGASATELLRAADITLYWAKSAGKAGWALFDEHRNANEVARYALSQALPAALEAGELFLTYQPIRALNGRHPHLVEALVRWAHPVRGLLGPGEFVPLAEQTGAIIELGRWVLRQAAVDAAGWVEPPARPPARVAVNVAVRQVGDPDLSDDVAGALAAAGLPAERLCLEITETALMDGDEEPNPGLAALRTLADAGIGIAVDDFGTGYSNLARLRHLPATSLKIDSSFVAGLGLDPADHSAEAVMTSLVTLAHAFGMTVTAEGVETAQQARLLVRLGVDYAQGYYYSRPVPSADVPAVLARWAEEDSHAMDPLTSR